LEKNKMDLQEEGCGGLYWIDLAQERHRWWELVKVALTFGLHKTRGIS
jgi:hypothetical protein